jgi:hypothetical protein
MTRYPFDLHGYHRPSGKSGKVEWEDPVNAFGSTYVPGAKEAKEAGLAAQEEEARKTGLRNRINMLYGGTSDPGGVSAKEALEAEKTKFAEATRQFHADELARDYEKAERNARFNLARRGALGGSGEVDVMSELSTDRNLGATRIDEAVRRAVMQLEAAREQERLSAIGLVNAGAGDSAVTAAQRGLQGAFETQSNAQKADLTSDLFSAGADAAAFQNLNDQQLAQLALYRKGVNSFIRPTSTTSGRVTPSS